MTEVLHLADHLPRLPGVYRIRNVASGRVYVGSSVNVRLRCRRHLRFLQRGTHDNWLLQAAWAKHGPQAFVLDLLEECDRASRFEREEYWIAKLGAYMGEGGYNILPHAGTVKGLKQTVTPQKREALTQGRRRYWSELSDLERRHRAQEIAATTAREYIVMYPDGTEERVFNLKQFSRKHGIGYNGLKKVAHFQQQQYGGFHVRPADMSFEEAVQRWYEDQQARNLAVRTEWRVSTPPTWRIFKGSELVAECHTGVEAAEFLGTTYGSAKEMRKRGRTVTRGPLYGYRIEK